MRMYNYSYVFPFEHYENCYAWSEWMRGFWPHSFTISSIYLVIIFSIKKFMENRKALSLRVPLILWNLALATFSIFGFARFTPEWYWSWAENSLQYSVCKTSFGYGVTGFWTEMFIASKPVQLFDTLFIVLRKKPLHFVHFFHHCTAMIATWHGFMEQASTARWFMWMNYGEHSLMYSYYAIRALHIKTPKTIAMLITTIQISQMIVGLCIGLSVFFFKVTGEECDITWQNILYTLGVFGSFFLLFCKFFFDKYIRRMFEKKKVEKKTEKVNEDHTTDANVNQPTTIRKRA